MKKVIVTVQIQMDIKDGEKLPQIQDILEEANNSMIGVSGDPQMFFSDISNSDIIEDDEEIDARDGVETEFGNISINHAMIDVDGTNLADGVEIRLDGELVATVIDGSYTFDSMDDLEEFISDNTEL
jgi:hypothetical protein